MQTKEEITPEQQAMFAEAAKAMTEKIDDVLSAARTHGKEVTIPAVTVGRDGTGKAVPAGADAQPVAARPVLTDAEVFDKCALFLDPNLLGPIFISKPIARRVYIGKYPNFGEILSAQRLIADRVGVVTTRDTDKRAKAQVAELQTTFDAVGELSIAIVGWLPEHDPGLSRIVESPGSPAKWPQLREFQTISTRDPRFASIVLPALWTDYILWKASVTPTDEELEKYYGLKS